MIDQLDNSEEIKKKIKELPPKHKQIAVALNHYLNLKKQSDDKSDVEFQALQVKYDRLTAPLLTELSDIITGKQPPKEFDHKYLEEGEQVPAEIPAKPIPQYWLKVLTNGLDIEELEITEKDKEALKHLTDIQLKWAENYIDFTLEFHFEENEFFSNSILTKSFTHQGDQEVKKCDASKIEWKQGKSLLKKTIKKKQRNKKTGAERTINKEVDAETFFKFFRSIDISDEEKMKKISEDEAIQMEECLDVDTELGRLLVDELLPYSVEYFLGVREDEDGEKKEKKEDDDEDFDDDSDEEEDKGKSKKKKSKK